MSNESRFYRSAKFLLNLKAIQKKIVMTREQRMLDVLNRRRLVVNSMVNDLPPDWGNNETISSFNELRDAIKDKDWKRGHIILDGDNFSIGGKVEFEGE